jgi:hypothetical protein
MNWEALGAIGEIVGAVAVVLTLGYLAVQMRQNTREVRLSAFQAVTDRIHQWNSDLARDPELARIYGAGLVDPKSLDVNERIRFEAHVVNQLRSWEDLFVHRRTARIEEDVWTARSVAHRRFLAEPGLRGVWERRKETFARDFQELIDREIALLSPNEASQTDDR